MLLPVELAAPRAAPRSSRWRRIDLRAARGGFLERLSTEANFELEFCPCHAAVGSKTIGNTACGPVLYTLACGAVLPLRLRVLASAPLDIHPRGDGRAI